MNPFRSLRDYELYTYSLQRSESQITRSTLVVAHSYEVWLGGDKLYWYDSQPHPNDPTLAGTHPHHKHLPPDIKHHRVPAPGLNFSQPNLPFLIAEILALAS